MLTLLNKNLLNGLNLDICFLLTNDFFFRDISNYQVNSLVNKKSYALYIKDCLGKYILSCYYNNYYDLVFNLDSKFLLNFFVFLKNHSLTKYKCLLDVFGVDFPYRKRRFEINYVLLSLYNFSQYRLRVKLSLKDFSIVDTTYYLFKSSDWLEREVWDMFGIRFKGHPDLRRLLTDYGFKGHPLRKDFPLTGFTQVRFDVSKRSIIIEKLKLKQMFRFYEFKSPWSNKKNFVFSK